MNQLQDDLISVIIPVYNVEKFLERCVKSVVEQSYHNLQIILVDDGSTDNSSELCDILGKTDDRISIIHKNNGGLSSARNAGLEFAKGKFISFIDSDDWIEQDMYNVLYQKIKAYSVKIVCGGRYDVYEADGVKKKGLCPTADEKLNVKEALKKLFMWDGIDSSACDKIFDSTLFDNIRFPIGKLSEDVAVMYKLFDLAEDIYFCSNAFYNYFHRQDSITTSSFSKKKCDFYYHTVEILSFISDKYPDLIEYAKYINVLAIIFTLKELDKTDKKIRKEFHNFSKVIRLKLLNSKTIWLYGKKFSKREKFTIILCIIGLYPLFYKIKHVMN